MGPHQNHNHKHQAYYGLIRSLVSHDNLYITRVGYVHAFSCKKTITKTDQDVAWIISLCTTVFPFQQLSFSVTSKPQPGNSGVQSYHCLIRIFELRIPSQCPGEHSKGSGLRASSKTIYPLVLSYLGSLAPCSHLARTILSSLDWNYGSLHGTRVPVAFPLGSVFRVWASVQCLQVLEKRRKKVSPGRWWSL